jgi:parvulin-like peptidyl-prolyl isomerase
MCFLRVIPILFALLLMQLIQIACAGKVEKKVSRPGGVIAEVDGQPVREEEFRSWLELTEMRIGMMGPSEREEALKQFVVDWRLAQKARKQGMEKSKAIQSLLETFDRKVLPDLYFRREFLDKVTVEEKDFESFFRGLTDLADVSVAVLVDNKHAREFLEVAKKGEPFEELVGRYSIGINSVVGGLIQYVTPEDFRFTRQELDAIFARAPGQLLGPFVNKLGTYSVIKVWDRKTVEDQKEEILNSKAEEVRRKKAEETYTSRISKEMASTEIEINEDFFSGKEGSLKTPYLAWMKGHYIYPQDLGINPAKDSHSLTTYRRNLDRLLRSIIAVDLARESGIADLPEYQTKREAYIVSKLALFMLDTEVRKAKPAATGKEIEKFYREWYLPEVYSVWVVLNRDEGDIKKARRALLEGEDAPEVAKKYSEDKSVYKGGVIGYLPLTAYDPEARMRILSMKKGEVSEIFRIGGKYAILQFLDRKKVSVPSLEKVREDVRRRIVLQKRAGFIEQTRAEILEETFLTIDQEKIAEMR